jgi:hypothetical protein
MAFWRRVSGPWSQRVGKIAIHVVAIVPEGFRPYETLGFVSSKRCDQRVDCLPRGRGVELRWNRQI